MSVINDITCTTLCQRGGKGKGVSVGYLKFLILVSGRGEGGLVACSEEFLMVVKTFRTNPSFLSCSFEGKGTNIRCVYFR